MGSNEDILSRDANDLNTNRIGQLSEILAIVDRDKEGNEVILQKRYPGSTQSQYLICSDERSQDLFLQLFRLLRHETQRDIRVVRLLVQEVEID